MSEQLAMRSPLNSVQGVISPRIELQDVALTELAFLQHVNVRFQPDDEPVKRRFRRIFGFDVPQVPNIFIVHEENLCAWLGPDEWLIMTPYHLKDTLAKAIKEFTSGDEFATCVEISAAQTLIRLTGSKAADLLGRGVSYDLHPGNFVPGSCVQTMLARTAVTLLAHFAEEMTIDVIVRRSFADYLWCWLVDAGQESEFYPL